MRIGADGAHLTYCSNIHPGETWATVRGNLQRYFTAVHDRVAPGAEFGIGLRLSAQSARELSEPAAFEEFRDFLRREKLYVFTVNGFPYGTFHDTRVKEAVYLPDWRDEERLRYTNQLADLLARLLPEQPGLEGSVSTVPCAYKPAVSSEAAVEKMADNLLRHVAHLIEVEQTTGRRITLAIEPEPYCLLETIDEAVVFFKRHLFGARAQPVFTPPWNRFAPELAAALPGLGLAVLSSYLPRRRKWAAPGLLQVNTHVDPIDWRERLPLDPAGIAARTAALLCARRQDTATNDEPFGLLTHHLAHDESVLSGLLAASS